MPVKEDDFGCGPILGVCAIAILVSWSLQEAILNFTGHNVSEVGCYWITGISFAITILLSMLLIYWRRTKSATEQKAAQAGWLGDIARQRAEEKRKQEDAYASDRREGRREGESVHKMVMVVLKEVGRAYWGSVGKDWNTRLINPGSSNVSWEVDDDGDHYWSVWLTRAAPEGWRFGITGGGETLYTANTSEAELRRVLRLAVEKGPAYRSN